jgi:hypothetical protein
VHWGRFLMKSSTVVTVPKLFVENIWWNSDYLKFCVIDKDFFAFVWGFLWKGTSYFLELTELRLLIAHICLEWDPTDWLLSPKTNLIHEKSLLKTTTNHTIRHVITYRKNDFVDKDRIIDNIKYSQQNCKNIQFEHSHFKTNKTETLKAHNSYPNVRILLYKSEEPVLWTILLLPFDSVMQRSEQENLNNDFSLTRFWENDMIGTFALP